MGGGPKTGRDSCNVKLGCGRADLRYRTVYHRSMKHPPVGQQELEALKRAASKIVTDETSQPPPPMVYHYASPDVAVKILDSFEMWCTNVAFSTDFATDSHAVPACHVRWAARSDHMHDQRCGAWRTNQRRRRGRILEVLVLKRAGLRCEMATHPEL